MKKKGNSNLLSNLLLGSINYYALRLVLNVLKARVIFRYLLELISRSSSSSCLFGS